MCASSDAIHWPDEPPNVLPEMSRRESESPLASLSPMIDAHDSSKSLSQRKSESGDECAKNRQLDMKIKGEKAHKLRQVAEELSPKGQQKV